MTARATGLTGKLPTHGDFVRRRLPLEFATRWEAWLDREIEVAQSALPGIAWVKAWEDAPAWRFLLPADAFGPVPMTGVLLPSRDAAGRHFPLSLAAPITITAWPAAVPDPLWLSSLEALGTAAAAGVHDADSLAAALPPPSFAPGDGALEGWWRGPDPAGDADGVLMPWPDGRGPARPGAVLLRLLGQEEGGRAR